MSQQSQNQMDLNHQQIQAAIAKVIWKDEKLRSEFVKDPKGAIEKNLGIKFAEGVNIKCIDETDPKTVYYVLPHHPSKALGVEFTDEQLDAVAGGFGIGSILGIGGGIVSGLTGFAGGLAQAIGGPGSGTAANILGGISTGATLVGGLGDILPLP